MLYILQHIANNVKHFGSAGGYLFEALASTMSCAKPATELSGSFISAFMFCSKAVFIRSAASARLRASFNWICVMASWLWVSRRRRVMRR